MRCKDHMLHSDLQREEHLYPDDHCEDHMLHSGLQREEKYTELTISRSKQEIVRHVIKHVFSEYGQVKCSSPLLPCPQTIGEMVHPSFPVLRP